MSYEQPGEQPGEQQQPEQSMSLEGILIAHVVCGATATLVLLPFGVLIPRCARALSTGRWWFTLHMAVQIIGIILALVALGTGFAQGGAEGAAHPGLGVVLAIGLGLQALLGPFIHWYKGRFHPAVAKSGRGYLHFVHIGLGLIVIIIGWSTAITGFLQEWSGENDAGEGMFVMGWKIVLGVLIGVFGLAYIIGISALRSKRNTPEPSLDQPGAEYNQMKPVTQRHLA